MPYIGPIKEETKITVNPLYPQNPTLRPPIKVSLGCHISGVSMPHVDPSDVNTIIAGVKKRFACRPPDPVQELLVRLRTFVLLWCCQHLVPLPPNTDVGIDTWLESTGYSRARINELKKKWRECGGVLQEKHYRVKSFVKDESYPEFKHARWINARSDVFKCAVGPIFKQIEKVVFKSDWFIKKIPVKDRAKYIYSRVYRVGAKFICTDYTAFESHFTAELMHACEFAMYDYMTQHLPDHNLFMFYLNHVIAGTNICESKLVTATVQATRMSGEMNTSLGNGFANLMFMLFMCDLVGATNVIGVVEGDDGLFVMDGPHPTAADFERLGLTIKLEVFDDLAKASFCGLVFDSTDLINIANPIKILAQTGFSTQHYVFSKSKVLRGLLKAKAFSLAYQFPGCPVISAFSRMLLRVLVDDYVYFSKNGDYTTLFQKEAFTFWQSHKDVLAIEPGMKTRILMEQVFDISVSEQLALEAYFDAMDTIQVLDHDIILAHIPIIWKTYGSQYMRIVPLDPLIIYRYYD
jgi:hypothetical protein